MIKSLQAPCLALIILLAGCTLPRQVNVRHLDQHLTVEGEKNHSSYVYTPLTRHWNSKNQSYLETGYISSANDTAALPQLVIGLDRYEEFVRFSPLNFFHRQREISRYKDSRVVVIPAQAVTDYFEALKVIRNRFYNNELKAGSRVKYYLDKESDLYVVLESSNKSLKSARQDFTKSTEAFSHVSLYIGDRRHRMRTGDFYAMLVMYRKVLPKPAAKESIQAK